MKFIITVFIATFLMANNYAFSGPLDKLERKLDRLFGNEPESGSDVRAAKKKRKADIKEISKNKLINPVGIKEVF